MEAGEHKVLFLRAALKTVCVALCVGKSKKKKCRDKHQQKRIRPVRSEREY